MSFNPDPSKRTPEVIFCRQIKKLSHPVLIFNNNRVIQTPYQKHLCLILDEKLNFGEDLIYIANRVNTSTGLLHKLKKYLPRGSLVTIHKFFIKTHLNYGDVIFDQAYNNSFHETLESLQYNASLATTGAIMGTTKEKLYQELGLESLRHRRWFRTLCTFYRIFQNQSQRYLYELLPLQATFHSNKSSRNISLFHFKQKFFRNFFFPSVIIE